MVVLALLSTGAMAQGLGKPGLAKSGGCTSNCTFTGTTTTSGINTSGTIALTATATSNFITSDTTAAVASATVGTLTLAPTASLGANDTVLLVQAILAGTAILKLDLEGDLTIAGGLGLTGDITPTSTFNLGSTSKGFGGLYTGASSVNGYVYGLRSDNVAAVGVRFSTTNALSTAGSRLVTFENADTVKAGVTPNGFYVQPTQTVTVADDAAGTAPASTITPTSSNIFLAYNDATSGSVGTMSETGAIENSVVWITHTGSGGTVAFADSNGVQEVGTTCTLAATDQMVMTYANSSWHLTACSSFAGGTVITDTLALTGTSTTGLFTSTTNDATTSTTVGSFTFKPTVNVTDGDLLFDFQNSAGGHTLTINEQGLVTLGSSLTFAGTGNTNTLLSSTANTGTDTAFVFDTVNNLNSSTDILVAFKNATSTQLSINNTGGLIPASSTAILGSQTLGQGFGALTLGDTNNSPFITGLMNNGSSAVGLTFNTNATYSTAGAKIAEFRTGGTNLKSTIDRNGFYFQPVQTVTVADDAAGTAPASTITPTSNQINLAYNDATNGSVGTIVEAATQAGVNITIVHTGSGGSVTFAESAGVLEGSCTLAAKDSMQLHYTNSAWYITSCQGLGRNTATIDFANKVAAGCQDSTAITVIGAAVGSECALGSPAAPEANSSFMCFVNATDQATVRHCCHTANCDPASATYAVRVFNP